MDSKIVQVALNGLENILRLGELEAKRGGGINPYCALIEEAYGKTRQTHPMVTISFMVSFFLPYSMTYIPPSCLFQVWISWSSFRATRTRRSIRKLLTWSSATSTRRTKTRRWLPPLTCSSSSSSFSSARRRWKASSYNPARPPPRSSGIPLTVRSFVSLGAHRQLSRLAATSALSLLWFWFNHNHDDKTHKSTEHTRVPPIWVKSCQPVCQGLSSWSS